MQPETEATYLHQAISEAADQPGAYIAGTSRGLPFSVPEPLLSSNDDLDIATNAAPGHGKDEHRADNPQILGFGPDDR